MPNMNASGSITFDRVITNDVIMKPIRLISIILRSPTKFTSLSMLIIPTNCPMLKSKRNIADSVAGMCLYSTSIGNIQVVVPQVDHNSPSLMIVANAIFLLSITLNDFLMSLGFMLKFVLALNIANIVNPIAMKR